ncbi:hypothetical protein FQZ97_979870 [compost metagenome]
MKREGDAIENYSHSRGIVARCAARGDGMSRRAASLSSGRFTQGTRTQARAAGNSGSGCPQPPRARTRAACARRALSTFCFERSRILLQLEHRYRRSQGSRRIQGARGWRSMSARWQGQADTECNDDICPTTMLSRTHPGQARRLFGFLGNESIHCSGKCKHKHSPVWGIRSAPGRETGPIVGPDGSHSRRRLFHFQGAFRAPVHGSGPPSSPV